MVLVARLGKTIGLRGCIRLHNLSDFPSQFKKGVSFFCAGKQLVIKAYNPSNRSILFEGYESVEKACELTNLELYQSMERTRKLCKLKKDEFFYFDILGCGLRIPERTLGFVRGIVETGGGYLFEVETDEALKNAGLPKIFFVPYADRFVSSIDTQKREILCKNEAYLILENS